MELRFSSTLPLLGLASKSFRYLNPQRRQLVPDNLPNNVEVDPKVVVDQLVSQSSHVLPGDFGVSLAKSGRQPLGGFSDDLQGPDNGVLSFGVGQKLLVALAC